MSTLTVLSIVAVAIILVLAVFAAYYIYQVRQLRKEQKSKLEELKKQGEEQRERINRSIQIIAQGIIDDQLTLTEGAIRIKVLLDGLAVDAEVQESYAAFYHLAAATDHIPILESWKSLPTKKKLEFDSQRTKLESDHREFVIDAAQRILGQRF